MKNPAASRGVSKKESTEYREEDELFGTHPPDPVAEYIEELLVQ